MNSLLKFTKTLTSILIEVRKIIKILNSAEIRHFKNKLRATIRFLLILPNRHSRLNRAVYLVTAYLGLSIGYVAVTIYAMLSIVFCYLIYDQLTEQAFLRGLLSFALMVISVIFTRVCSVLSHYSHTDLVNIRKKA